MGPTAFRGGQSGRLLSVLPHEAETQHGRRWVDRHPYDVITIMLGNGNYSKPEVYAPYIESTGIVKYLYEAPVQPMALDDWPTLEYLILRGKRVIMFMDYEANQTAYPWLLDEFSAMSEVRFFQFPTPQPIDSDETNSHFQTPFNPTNRDWPLPLLPLDGTQLVTIFTRSRH